MGNSAQRIDTPGELKSLLWFLFAAAVVGMMFGAVVLAVNPTVDDRVRYVLSEEPEYAGGQIAFTGEQIDEMSGVYEDMAVEFGWCLKIRDDRVTDMAHPYNISEMTERSIAFSCKNANYNGILHTHPGVLGAARLSEQDADVLQEVDLIEVSCVLSESIEGYSAHNPAALNCYNTDLEQLAIRIER